MWQLISAIGGLAVYAYLEPDPSKATINPVEAFNAFYAWSWIFTLLTRGIIALFNPKSKELPPFESLPIQVQRQLLWRDEMKRRIAQKPKRLVRVGNIYKPATSLLLIRQRILTITLIYFRRFTTKS